MERVLAILSHPATAMIAGLYLMGISFAWTFFGLAPHPFVIGTLLWIGGGMLVAGSRKLMDRADR